LPHFTDSKQLGTSQAVRTMLCSTQDEGQVVCKLYVQDLPDADKVVERMRRIRERFDLRRHPNILVLVMD